MTTKPKRWPNNCEWARLDCIALSRQGRRSLIEILDEVNDPVILRKITITLETFREIEAKLVSVGAKQEENDRSN